MNDKIFKAPPGEQDIHAYHTRVEEKISALIPPFDNFIKSQALISIGLLIATVIAITLASNEKTSAIYHEITNLDLKLIANSLIYKINLKFIINDLLLVLFFFVIGLEIKREFIVGELSDIKKSSLVIIAAISGMLVPAILYVFITNGTNYEDGFGIVMATDTAFAIGLLSLFKRKLNPGVFTFIIALAIIDDIGAVTIIALFYSHAINPLNLILSLVFISSLVILNIIGYRKPLFYFIFGILVWYFLETGGIHGSVAGIIVALTIPARPKKGPNTFIEDVKKLISKFERKKQKVPLILEDPEQHEILEKIKINAEQATTPLQRWEKKLYLPVGLIILPLFAITNAGIELNTGTFFNSLHNSFSIAIIVGLLVGKPLGIFLTVYLLCKYRICALPNDTKYKEILGASLFCGVGFTMSIFIAGINFDTDIIQAAKIAIISASFLSAIIGSFIIALSKQST